jgi:membrane-associated phospholipid phosphatase
MVIGPGISFIISLQSQIWAAPFMQAASILGVLEFYLLIMPALYWCWDVRTGFRLALILVLSQGMGEALKVFFHSPRPYWISYDITALDTYPSFGLPSSHAMNAVAFWGLLARSIGGTTAWLAALALIFLIGLSRVYLGVHFPGDVAAGWLSGALLLLLFIKMEPRASGWLSNLRPEVQIIISLAASLFLLALYAIGRSGLDGWSMPPAWAETALASSGEPISPHSPRDALLAAGMVFGMGSGYALLPLLGGFSTRGSLKRRVARYILGMVGLLLIWYGLGSLDFQDPIIWSAALYLRAFLAGGWVALGAPYLFVRAGLARSIEGRRESKINNSSIR